VVLHVKDIAKRDSLSTLFCPDLRQWAVRAVGLEHALRYVALTAKDEDGFRRIPLLKPAEKRLEVDRCALRQVLLSDVLRGFMSHRC